MTNKEEYIKYLKTNNFSITIFYEFYNEVNKKEEFNMELVDFEKLFGIFVQQHGLNHFMGKLRNHYHVKFEIIEVFTKEGKLIDFY